MGLRMSGTYSRCQKCSWSSQTAAGDVPGDEAPTGPSKGRPTLTQTTELICSAPNRDLDGIKRSGDICRSAAAYLIWLIAYYTHNARTSGTPPGACVLPKRLTRDSCLHKAQDNSPILELLPLQRRLVMKWRLCSTGMTLAADMYRNPSLAFMAVLHCATASRRQWDMAELRHCVT